MCIACWNILKMGGEMGAMKSLGRTLVGYETWIANWLMYDCLIQIDGGTPHLNWIMSNMQ